MPTPEMTAVIWRQLRELHERRLSLGDQGVVSFYPPEMESERDLFGIATTALDGTTWHVGDCDFAFPLHSISKVFTYGMALEDNGRKVTLKRVGVEPAATRSTPSSSTSATTARSTRWSMRARW